jgi:hypothetical protein
MDQDQQPRPWWKDNWAVLALVALAGVIATITLLGYLLSWEWTGLVGIPENPDTRTAWDWLGLLIIPILLILFVFWFSIRDRKYELERARNEQELTQDRAREGSFQHYMDMVLGFILAEGLRMSERNTEIWNMARTRTLAVLRSLDGNRKGEVIGFLYDANLIGTVVEESGERRVIEAIIYLGDADLNGAKLFRSNLSDADLNDANLRFANLNGAYLVRGELRDADLRDAHLSFADLTFANLSGANLNNTNLFRADLTQVDLRGAKGWTNEQFAQAESLVNATMPDGTKMTEEAWEEFKKSYG